MLFGDPGTHTSRGTYARSSYTTFSTHFLAQALAGNTGETDVAFQSTVLPRFYVLFFSSSFFLVDYVEHSLWLNQSDQSGDEEELPPSSLCRSTTDEDEVTVPNIYEYL